MNGLRTSFTVCSILSIVLISGCASQPPKTPPPESQTVVQHDINKTATQSSKKPLTRTTGDLIVANAESVLGAPYRYGGNNPSTGFDCSGLVYYSYGQLGLNVPRTTKQQALHATPLALNEIEPGDILFFKIYGSGVSHVGIYTGNNQFIHAPKSGKQVSYADVNQPFWRERLIKVGRLH